MAVVAMKQLLEAGVHFGHQTRRWDPRMAEYIFQARNGIHIIDLQKTSKKIDEAYRFIKEQVEEGKDVLFVGAIGRYWSSVPSSENSAAAVFFYSMELTPHNYDNRCRGLSVRLVKDI